MIERIRVLVVDDHPVVTSGLEAILFAASDLELAGAAKNGREALLYCERCSPDVILMDLMMPGMDGIDVIKMITARYPQMRIIALTSFREADLVQAALSAGAIGYLLKDATAAELTAAIRAAHRGQATLSPAITQVLVQSMVNPTSKPDLTEREIEMLDLITRGLTNNQIAQELDISLSTVQFHIGNIFSKLGVTSRVEAAVLAERHDLLNRTG